MTMSRQLCTGLVFLLVAAAANAFSFVNVKPSLASKSSSTARSMSEVADDMVTMRTLSVEITSKPLGIVLEELGEEGESAGVFCAELDEEGAAYQAGIREGDVLAALDGSEEIFAANLDGAMELLGAATLPIPLKVYRQLGDEGLTKEDEKVVRMAPRRLPTAKKLVKASTNAKFWQDPLMIGSAVLTVAMPLGIFIASSGSKGM